MNQSRINAAPLPVEAVAACARALAGSRTGELFGEASRAASTLDALRAAGDRAALRTRFHDSQIHARHRPQDSAAAVIFDAFEDARLDVLGLGWLPGVAANLMRHPGAASHPVRWVVFELLSDRRAPDGASLPGAPQERMLSPARRGSVVALRPIVGDQAQFAEASARLAGALAVVRGWADAAMTEADAIQLPSSARAGADSAGDEFGRNAEAETRQRGSAPHARESGPGPAPHDRADSRADYRVFTTAHDRVVDAASLAGPAELARLRACLDRELGDARVVVTRLANRLRRLLLGRQARRWHFDVDEGYVDGRRLADLVAGHGQMRVFKQEGDSPFPSAAVTLLIDHSGSMRGRPMLMAALTVEMLVQALERCGVCSEVLGFTTRDWDDNRAARDWTACGRPAGAGRLNALEHIVIKAADVPWRRARAGLGLALMDELLKENIDGEAIRWAHARLARRREQRRLLLVVSDGAPRDEATERVNGADYLARDLRTVVAGIESRSPVRIAAIGLGHDVSRFYARSTTITRIEDLSSAVSDALTAFLVASRR